MGVTPLNLAIMTNSFPIIDYLMKSNGLRPVHLSLFNSLIRNYQTLSHPTFIAKYFIDDHGFQVESSTMFLAAKHGWSDLLSLVKEKCFDAKDLDGWTILHFAASNGKVHPRLQFIPQNIYLIIKCD